MHVRLFHSLVMINMFESYIWVFAVLATALCAHRRGAAVMPELDYTTMFCVPTAASLVLLLALQHIREGLVLAVLCLPLAAARSCVTVFRVVHHAGHCHVLWHFCFETRSTLCKFVVIRYSSAWSS